MDARQGQCLFCGGENSYQRTDCHECGTRLPWADDVQLAKTSAPAPADPAEQSPGDPSPVEPDIKISMPSQWLPPEQSPTARGSSPVPLPTVVFSGGGFSRNCCCGCLLLIIFFMFLPLSCVMMTGGYLPVEILPFQTEIQPPAAPR